MKRLMAIAFGALSLLSACSPSDNDSEPITTETDYFPEETGNFWVYKVSGTNFESGRDSLYVANDTIISGNSCKKFKTKTLPLGFYSNSANNNSIRKVNDKIVLTGSAGLNFGEALPVDVSLTDFVIFKQSAVADEELDSETGVIEQEFDGFPLTITYTLKTIAMGRLPNFTAPDQKSYSDILKVKTILKLQITTDLGGLAVPVLRSQDVITSTQYYSKNIGVVYANTTITYNLEAIASTFGIPQTTTQTSEEVLDIYSVD